MGVDMEADLIAALTANTGVTLIAGQRVAWGARPQTDSLPAVVLHKVAGGASYSMDGRTGPDEALVQIDCWAGSANGAQALSEAVAAALETMAPLPFQGAFITSEMDLHEMADGGPKNDSTEFYRRALTVRIFRSR